MNTSPLNRADMKERLMDEDKALAELVEVYESLKSAETKEDMLMAAMQTAAKHLAQSHKMADQQAKFDQMLTAYRLAYQALVLQLARDERISLDTLANTLLSYQLAGERLGEITKATLETLASGVIEIDRSYKGKPTN